MNAQEAIRVIEKEINHRKEFNQKHKPKFQFPEEQTQALSIVLKLAQKHLDLSKQKEETNESTGD